MKNLQGFHNAIALLETIEIHKSYQQQKYVPITYVFKT